MLVCTTSCDDGVQFDMACDGCGEVLVAGPAERRDPPALRSLAHRLGWVAGIGPGVLRCAGCATRPALTATSNGGRR